MIQKGLMFFAYVLMSALPFHPAVAQSSHDQAPHPGPKIVEKREGYSTRLEIHSHDNRYSMGVTGYLQENNRFTYRKNGDQKRVKLELNQARLSLYGNVLHPSLTYLVQLALENKEPDRDILENGRTVSDTQFLSDYYFNCWCIPH